MYDIFKCFNSLSLLWLIIVNTHLGHPHNDNDEKMMKKKMMMVVMIIVWDYLSLESWGLGVWRLMGFPSGQH